MENLKKELFKIVKQNMDNTKPKFDLLVDFLGVGFNLLNDEQLKQSINEELGNTNNLTLIKIMRE